VTVRVAVDEARWSMAVRNVVREKNEPRLLSWLVLMTHRLGLPFHGSPLFVLLPLRVSSIEPDDDGPTSFRRGEGHRVCLAPWLARWRGGDGVGGMKGG